MGNLGRRKAYVMVLGAVGLAGALTLAAFVAPNRAAAAVKPYTPASAAEVVAHVPARDPREVAERQELASSPDRVELAIALARADLERERSRSPVTARAAAWSSATARWSTSPTALTGRCP